MNKLLKNPSFVLGLSILSGIATGYCVTTAYFFPIITYDPDRIKRENKLFIQGEFDQLRNVMNQSFKTYTDTLDKRFDEFGKNIRYGNKN